MEDEKEGARENLMQALAALRDGRLDGAAKPSTERCCAQPHRANRDSAIHVHRAASKA